MTGHNVEAGVDALRRGDLIIFPTETVYGLAADACNPRAVAKIFQAKGRPQFNPLISHVADIAAAAALAIFDDRAQALAEEFWPGPLTLVLPARPDGPICDLARAGLETVAVRAPSHPLARAVLARFGGAVAAPSANRSGRPSPTTYADAVAETGVAASVSLDGGPCAVGLESTVVALIEGRPALLLRPGGVTRGALERRIGPLGAPTAGSAASPGRLTLHYAPEAPIRLGASAPKVGEAYLAFGPAPETGGHVFNLSPTADLAEAAANLFTFLRAADRLRPAGIAVAPIPHNDLGEAINDRLARAAGFIG